MRLVGKGLIEWVFVCLFVCCGGFIDNLSIDMLYIVQGMDQSSLLLHMDIQFF